MGNSLNRQAKMCLKWAMQGGISKSKGMPKGQ